MNFLFHQFFLSSGFSAQENKSLQSENQTNFFLSKKCSTIQKRQQIATKIQPDKPRILCLCVFVPRNWHFKMPHNCSYHQLIPAQGLWHWCSAKWHKCMWLEYTAGIFLQVSWRIPGSTCSWLLLQAIELLITQQICTFSKAHYTLLHHSLQGQKAQQKRLNEY